MEAFARALMGLSHPVQIIGQARTVETHPSWPRPPQLERRWLAVFDDDASGWRTRTLTSTIEGVGLRCAPVNVPTTLPPWKHTEIGPDYARGDWPEYTASLVLRRWPREVAPGWLGNALANDLPVDVSMHIEAQDSAWIARKLKLQQKRHQGSDDAGDMLTTRDSRRVREDLIAHKDRPVKVAVAFTVRAPSREMLMSRVETLRHEIGLTLGDVRPVTWEHDRGLEATSATGVCRLLGAWHTLDCTSVASTWPFQPATINHQDGVDIGVTRKGDMLVRLDPFDAALEGFSGVVVGKKRMGKSYLMKIIARGLAARGVEVTIIEQRNPPEYAVLAHLPNIELINIEQIAADEEDADVQTAKRVAHLRKVTGELWDRARRDPRPRMLIIDEAWMLLRHAHTAAWIETVARTGGHFGLALWILTQQVRELLESGRAALDNAEIRIFLKQHDADLDDICDAVGLKTISGATHPAKLFLRSATRGQVLLGVGDLWVDVDVARVPEHYEISTDPRDVWNQIDNEREESEDGADGVGTTTSEDRAAVGRGPGVWLDRRGGGRSGRAAVAAADQ
jgi:hypothetical protein